MLKLSKRLKMLSKMVPQGARIADIGTDHAFLPCYLVQTGISPSAIGGDVHLGPYEKALQTVKEYGLEDKIHIRLGNGLTILKPDEVETVIIAGMGGGTIKEIFNQSPEVINSLQQLIIQPMIGSELVRTWLSENGWVIVDEEIISEDKRLYLIINAVKGKAVLNEAEIYYGPILIKKRHPLLEEILQKDVYSLQEILIQLEKTNSEESIEKRNRLLKRINIIKGLQKCLFPVKR